MTNEQYRPGARVGKADASDRGRALDLGVVGAVPPVLTVLAVVYAGLAVAHLLLVPDPHRVVLAVLAGLTAGLFLLGLLLLRRWSIPPGMGHAVGTIIAGVTLVNSILHLQLTAEPRHTTTFFLVILGVGLFFLDRAWFGVVATLTLAGWLLASRTHLPDPEWGHFGFSLILATCLAAVVMEVRYRNFVRVEELRQQDRVRQLELESALARTEAMRRDQARARQELEAAVARLQESEGRFRRLAAATFEGVIIHRDGIILDANSRAAKLFGVAVDQLVGARVLELVGEEERDRAKALLLGGERDQGSQERMEVTGRRRDGQDFPMEIGVISSQHEGRPARVLVIRDISQQKEVEEVLRRALEEAEANSRAKSSFLTNMSHELRTPLNSVIGFANILLKKVGDDLPPRELDYLKRILGNGEHLLSLIEDILDLSKIDAQRMELLREPVDLMEICREVVQTLDLQARKRGLELRKEIPTDLRPVVADGRRMRQVLLNLVGNAIKFTPAGRVTIRVVVEEGSDRPTRVEVEDTGIGIPESRLEEVFRPFHQVDFSQARSFGGTGLGLAISQSLCELMGFTLLARSREGEGSTFVVDLNPPESRLGEPSPLAAPGEGSSSGEDGLAERSFD